MDWYPAAFEMEEILYELRKHSAGLNAGCWDYLFSVIKCFGAGRTEYLLPDRNSVTMTAPFLRAYTELLVSTCHRRHAHAIGGLAAFVPSRRAPEVNERAWPRSGRTRRARPVTASTGHGWRTRTWCPCAGRYSTAVLAIKPTSATGCGPISRSRRSSCSTSDPRRASFTEDGLRNNVSVALQYLAAWLGGRGAVAINNLMEDAAAAEIARRQVWQWLASGVVLADGTTVTLPAYSRL